MAERTGVQWAEGKGRTETVGRTEESEASTARASEPPLGMLVEGPLTERRRRCGSGA